MLEKEKKKVFQTMQDQLASIQKDSGEAAQAVSNYSYAIFHAIEAAREEAHRELDAHTTGGRQQQPHSGVAAEEEGFSFFMFFIFFQKSNRVRVFFYLEERSRAKRGVVYERDFILGSHRIW